MANNPPDPDSNDPVPPPSPSVEGPDAPSFGAESDARREDAPSPSFALDMARLWVQRHQKASMLGAFAAGVFVGALLRD